VLCSIDISKDFFDIMMALNCDGMSNEDEASIETIVQACSPVMGKSDCKA